MSVPQFELSERHKERFVPQIPILPQGRFVSLILIRESMSNAIFTTEGDILDTERVQAGLNGSPAIDRVIMFKRKQIAPERRTGKALLRQVGAFPFAVPGSAKGKKGEKTVKECYLLEGMCGYCPDCVLYGYAAVEGQGARKSRVLTDSAFSVRPYQAIQEHKKFNAINDDSMTSHTINELDHLRPQVFLPTIETCVDVTAGEFLYILGNILKTTRYGKEVSRGGRLRNHLVGIAFSDVELFSNLEFSQAFYEALSAEGSGAALSDGYLSLADFLRHLPGVLETLLRGVYGSITLVTGEEISPKNASRVRWEEGLARFKEDLSDFWADEARVKAFLIALTRDATQFAAKAPTGEAEEEEGT
ncbi:MAG: type I-D CRISPR-associated protein Cas7/Csc2 [Candidatus Tectomicrobia bacterium]|uniref:Type I-D CRISPR-associated protein Cas7/Csc2 n=1 Tax=Tectimicrobiota bacterium TaxID=2528274 RepID=A0A932CLQ5_UNCTE|nr:type I-D CRISPR-associated protein Cas7/Csc2 [Candidatus Tectomicrobia bacterium]